MIRRSVTTTCITSYFKRPHNSISVQAEGDTIRYIYFVFTVGPKPTLKDLMNDVAAIIPDQWRDVGIQLWIAPGHLNDMERSIVMNLSTFPYFNTRILIPVTTD